jgi:hypothetical protein
VRWFAAAAAPDEDGEFSFTVPGELCFPTYPCDAQEQAPVDVCSCGCTTAWAGLVSRCGTTCATVVELDVDPGVLVDMLIDFGAGDDREAAREARDDILLRLSGEAFVDRLSGALASFEVGDLLWRDRNTIGVREPA